MNPPSTDKFSELNLKLSLMFDCKIDIV